MSESTENTSPKPPHSWIHLIAGLLLLAVASGVTFKLVTTHLRSRPLDMYSHSQHAIEAAEEVLLANRIPKEFIEKSNPAARGGQEAQWYYYEYRVRIPEAVSISGIEELIAKRLHSLYANVVVSDYVADGRKRGIQLAFDRLVFAEIYLERQSPDAPRNNIEFPTSAALPRHDEELSTPQFRPAAEYTSVKVSPTLTNASTLEALPLPETPLPVPVDEEHGNIAHEAQLAIIIDDGGYGGSSTERILALSPNLTLAILPNTPNGVSTAERASALGFELMLHMPMENMNPKLYPHEGQLEVNMSREKILALTKDALAQVPGAVGVNNHMGSRFTADADAMGKFIEAVQDMPLFFIDSRTTSDTQAYKTARTFGIPAGHRDVFLDHIDEVETIRQQFEEAVTLALTRGQAIAIGHFRPDTATVLEELLPTLDGRGIELVHASTLIK